MTRILLTAPFSENHVNSFAEFEGCEFVFDADPSREMLESVDVEALKNTPCILVASRDQQEEEEHFCRDIIGFKGDILFADSLQAARVMVISGRGVMPVEGPDQDPFFGSTLKRVPLTREGIRLKRSYCAFWKKDNSGYYVEEFADILRGMYL